MKSDSIRGFWAVIGRRWLPAAGVVMGSLLVLSSTAPGQENRQFPPSVDPQLLAAAVRNTAPNTPQQEQEHLFAPPGFRVQLIASEPEIAKPMNLAFDERGRLWVSHSVEYPVAAASEAPHRDQISVIEDTDGDGVPDTASTFADGLNIPIGLCPVEDGVICFSIPNILYLRDTDQDGRADRRDVLYGPFDTTRDTHGMCNAFRRGADGWIYACHGFNNQSSVSGRDGHTVTMKSGNVFRFRPDGSRIEHFTYGQVNPFGMAIDQFGDIFTADCHTKPVSLLLKGGCYDSFGRPHDGLGYVPPVMDHLHGSTAIGGIALGVSSAFPEEYRDNSFGGNVMTSRVNRNRLVRTGSTVRAVEQPDFLVSTDPWFRPVDLVFGPDGALYVADFYNRIIGHYEVPLDHPGRDRTSGRIWRVSWECDSAAAGHNATQLPDFASLAPDALIGLLSTSNEVHGRLLMDVIADHDAAPVAAPLREAAAHGDSTARRRAIRLLQRMQVLDLESLAAAVTDEDPLVRVHAFRALAELDPADLAALPADDEAANGSIRALLIHGFQDPEPMVQRTAVLAAAEHPQARLIRPLMTVFHAAATDDLHLKHSVRMTLRDHLQHAEWFSDILTDLSEDDAVLVGTICPALDSPAAADFVVQHLELFSRRMPTQVADLIQFAAPRASPASIGLLVAGIRTAHAGNTDAQIELMWPIIASLSGDRSELPSEVTDWTTALTCDLLGIATLDDADTLHLQSRAEWHYVAHATAANPDNCWTVTTRRRSSDGVAAAELFSSFEAGESRTGILRSSSFVLPAQFTFYIAGHAGVPDKAPHQETCVRLVDQETGEIIRVAYPPRNDVAQQTEWDLADVAGRSAFLELVDGDTAGAFAWMAAGRFSVDGLNPDQSVRRQIRAASVVAACGLDEFRPLLTRLLQSDDVGVARRAAFAMAISELSGNPLLKAISVALESGTLPDELARRAAAVIARDEVAQAEKVLTDACRVVTSAHQKSVLNQLCDSGPGASFALQLLETGSASAQCLFDPALKTRLEAALAAPQQPRLRKLLEELPNEDAHLAELIATSRTHVEANPGNAEHGAAVFRKNCSVCHQIRGVGERIGPNLDGIGNRGFDRLLEDVLAPSRNVDVAFRASTVVLQDGRVLAGLVQETPAGMKVIDAKGKATAIANDEIEERIDSLLSPMPANVTELLTRDEFSDLISYLLSQRH